MNTRNVGIVWIFVGALLLASGAEARSEAAKNAFKAMHPCPATGARSGPCPGYVIDHIQPLACGGADEPSNMQWQSEAEGKAKDKWERDGCEAGGAAGSGGDTVPAPNGGHYHLGPRRGCYELSAGGRKRYVERGLCGE